MRGVGLIMLLLVLGWMQSYASDDNITKTSRIEIVVTVAGVKETVASIERSSKQIAALTAQLSNKQDFSDKDHELIAGLTKALNNNADAINKIADALPQQFESVQRGMSNVLDTAMINAEHVVKSSKNELVDPTLNRIENRVLLLILLIAVVLFALLWFGLWKLRKIVSIGSETISNVSHTMKSLEKVLEKINKTE